MSPQRADTAIHDLQFSVPGGGVTGDQQRSHIQITQFVISELSNRTEQPINCLEGFRGQPEVFTRCRRLEKTKDIPDFNR